MSKPAALRSLSGGVSPLLGQGCVSVTPTASRTESPRRASPGLEGWHSSWISPAGHWLSLLHHLNWAVSSWSQLYIGYCLMAGAQKHSWEHGGIYTFQLWCWIMCLCLKLILTYNTRDTNGHSLHHSVHFSSWLHLAPKEGPHEWWQQEALYKSPSAATRTLQASPIHAGTSHCHVHLQHRREHFHLCICCSILSSHFTLTPAQSLIQNNSSETSMTETPITKPSVSIKSNLLSCTYPTARLCSGIFHSYAPNTGIC